jgi:predicted LPLAT superfamily acyltransferase
MNPPQWSSRSVGSRWQHEFFYLLIRLGGRRAAYLLLYFVVAYYILLCPAQRRKSEFYLKRRFPHAGRCKRLLNSYRLILELGKALIDRAIVGLLGPGRLKVNFTGRDWLLSQLRQGKGIILMTAHVGCWQAALSALNFTGKPVTLLMHQEADDIDRHYYEHAKIACPYDTIDPRGYLGGVLEMLNVLKGGGILSVMGDRILGSTKGTLGVDFLGAKIRVPFSAFKLASVTGAPLCVLFSFKSGPDSYVLDLARVIHVPDNLGRRVEAFIPYAQQFADELEAFTDKHPFQFFNFFDMWEEK